MYTLCPVPQKSRFTDLVYDFSESRWIIVDPRFSPVLLARVLEFAALESHRFHSGLEVTAGEPVKAISFLRIEQAHDELPNQGYRLQTGLEGIRLQARDDAGAFYGLQTVRQILLQCDGAFFPECGIIDFPRFAARGFMLDISRCKVPTMETLYRYVDLLAFLKYNQFQLYIEHTFAFSAHETVWNGASPVTADEILRLDAYCRDRFIELVPNLNSFGHLERWLRHPQYRHLAECPDGYVIEKGNPTFPNGRSSPWGTTLKPGRESLEFLDGLYREFLPNFRSSLFNAGCDETWELGLGASAKACERSGTARVYLDFLQRIFCLVSKYRRTMMFWGDIILRDPSLINELPADIIALNWGYEAGHPFDRQCAAFAGTGVPFYVCPGTSSWNSLVGRTGTCLANLAEAARYGEKHGAAGYLVTDWGDNGHHQYFPVSLPGIVAGGANGWSWKSAKNLDVPEVLDRLVLQDPSGACGTVIMEMGAVHETTGVQLKNRSVFNELLFSGNDAILPILERVPHDSLSECIERLDALGTWLKNSAPAVSDGRLIVAEVKNALAMTRFSARKGRAIKKGNSHSAALKRSLESIVRKHRRLWLARNRPGGLDESVERLEKAGAW